MIYISPFNYHRMASPPVGSGSSSGHSPLPRVGGSMRVHSQSPPPPSTQPLAQPILVAQDHRHRQQVQQAHTSSSPGIERRRNLSPRQLTTTTTNVAASSSPHSASPALSNSPSESYTFLSTLLFFGILLILKSNVWSIITICLGDFVFYC